MDILSFIFGIGPQFLLFLAAFKFHQRRKLPKLLLIGLTLALIFSLPTALNLALGVERLQAMLFELFPVANDPGGLTDGTTYHVGKIAMGELYIRLLEIGQYIESIPIFLIGFGFFQFVRGEIRAATPEHPTHLPS